MMSSQWLRMLHHQHHVHGKVLKKYGLLSKGGRSASRSNIKGGRWQQQQEPQQQHWLYARQFCSSPPSSNPNPNPNPNPTKHDNIFKDQNDTWVDRKLPEYLIPYAKIARIDRPIGTYLLMFPGWWSIALAAPNGSLVDLKMLGLFGVGAFVMRGAGCTINDFWDRDIDGKVARTKSRPLASGAISPIQAIGFLGAQCTVGLGVLLQLNDFSIALGAASLLPVVLYPLAKRVTNWPQAVLGLTFNWGALLGWAAIHESLDLSVVLPLYFGSALWTLTYDTIYAHQDKTDDKTLGLKSSALTIGDKNTKPVLSAFASGTIALWTLAGHNAGLSESIFFHSGVGLSAAHLGWQIWSSKLDDRLNLTKRFVSNGDIGVIMMTGIVMGKLFE